MKAVNNESRVKLFIRHYQASDLNHITELFTYKSVMENTSQNIYLSPDSVEALFSNTQNMVLVAQLNTKVVGYVCLYLSTKSRSKHCANLAIAVHPDAQGQGIGKALLVEALGQADNWLNIVRIELDVHTDNFGAISLYKSLGFETEGIKRLSSYKAGKYVDLALMARIRDNV